MSYSRNKTDSVILKRYRPLLSVNNECYSQDYLNDADKTRDRTCSIIHRRSITSSLPTGSIIHRRSITSSLPTSISPSEELQIYTRVIPTVFLYDKDTVEETNYPSIEDIPTIKIDECLWIDVTGVHDKALLSSISQRFQIHPLVIFDIQTNEQRTKLDVFEDALFFVCKLIYPDRSTQATCIEQISFYIKENVLITFQEKHTDIFDQIKNRIRLNKGRIRKSKVDYLFYSLVDTIVDRYMDVLDIVNTKVEAIDHQLMKNLSRETLETIYDLKRDMLEYRCIISPLKEIINRLQKEEETEIIQENTIIYLKDLFDHVVQVNDTIDTYREMLSSFIDFYMMLNSNAMNEVVKTLTIISTIFIPLTFIAGVYGMNFEHMPELQWKYSYFIVLICMIMLALLMLSYFKKKKWL